MIQLANKKGRFPSTTARFCTQILKVNPFIDYVLDEIKGHFVVYQGQRKDESKNRSALDYYCTYFKYYFEPYGKDENGKNKFFTYRKKDVIKFKENGFLDDVYRPVIDMTANEVLELILQEGHKPNQLYYKGAARVGCFPCVMNSHKELVAYIKNAPEVIEKVIEAEKETGVAFFPPSFIPKHYCDIETINKKGETVHYASAKRVFKYLTDRHLIQGELFEDNKESDNRCMSFYNICE